MSANFYDLLKYAATGISSPSMTYYDRMRASTLMGGVVQTLTGIPPLSFKSDGTPLISWSMKGNGQQTGTPTQSAPIQPEFVGIKTANLWDEDYTGIGGSIKYVPLHVGDGSFTLSTTAPLQGESSSTLFFLAGNVSSGAAGSNKVYYGNSLTVTAIDGYVTVAFRSLATVNPADYDTMLNTGETALPYEPFGWAEKITCGGETTPVYLGQVRTVRRVNKLVFTGNESWNYSTQGNNTRAYTPQIAECLSLSPAICTHFAYNVANVGYPRKDEFVINSSKAIIFGIDGSVFTDKTAWTTYLQQQYAAGTPVTVWYVLATPTTAIVNEPLCKIGNYADELSSTVAGVSIPTTRGQNTLTVDTELQPSEMTITYKG